jgi:hypothetical protein
VKVNDEFAADPHSLQNVHGHINSTRRIQRTNGQPNSLRPEVRAAAYPAGVTKSSLMRNAADEPVSTRLSRMKRTASRIRASRLSSSGLP